MVRKNVSNLIIVVKSDLSLGFAGVIFFLTPTFHFLTSIIILNEEITNIKLLTFIIIWIAVAIFVNEKIREN